VQSPWDETVYVLAELLKMPVYKIKEEMPLSELIGWCRYFEKKNNPNPAFGNGAPVFELASMSKEDLKKAFG
jgi:hypothetical protein